MLTIMTAFNSDPYIALLYRKSFERWKDEVDQLLVCCHSGNNEIDQFNKHIWDKYDNVEAFVSDEPYRELGLALDFLYPKVKGDVVGTIDSDNFIFKSGVVKKWASLIPNNCDVVGYLGSVAFKPAEFYNDIIKLLGSSRVNTFFSLWSKKIIDEMDVKFKRFQVYKGYKIPELNYVVPYDWAWFDTMALLSLRYFTRKGRGRFVELTGAGEKPKHFYHIGGMSAASRIVFRGEDGKSIMDFNSRYLDYKFAAERMAIYMHAYLMTKDECSLKDFNDKYYKSMLEKMEHSDTKMSDVMDEVEKIERMWRMEV